MVSGTEAAASSSAGLWESPARLGPRWSRPKLRPVSSAARCSGRRSARSPGRSCPRATARSSRSLPRSSAPRPATGCCSCSAGAVAQAPVRERARNARPTARLSDQTSPGDRAAEGRTDDHVREVVDAEPDARERDQRGEHEQRPAQPRVDEADGERGRERARGVRRGHRAVVRHRDERVDGRVGDATAAAGRTTTSSRGRDPQRRGTRSSRARRRAGSGASRCPRRARSR